MKVARLAAVVTVLLLAACASWKWSGTRVPDGRGPNAALRGVADEERAHPAPPGAGTREDAEALTLSTGPARAPVLAPVPAASDERAGAAMYYSDIGPDSVDVSAYPAQQRYQYAIYARTCSRCHTLARSINAPLVGRGWWEFYMLGMRMRSRREGRPLTPDETKSILDFLEYDSRVRKVEGARRFDALTEELKRRFDVSVSERLRQLQKKNPRLLPETGR